MLLRSTLFHFCVSYTDRKNSEPGQTEIQISNKKIKYTKSENSNTLCPITQMEFEEQQDIIQLDCNHCFDPEAILYWLKEEKAECPVCRFKYKSIEVNEVNEVIENNDLHRSRENLYTSLMRVHFF